MQTPSWGAPPHPALRMRGARDPGGLSRLGRVPVEAKRQFGDPRLHGTGDEALLRGT